MYGGCNLCTPAGTAGIHNICRKCRKAADQLKWSASYLHWSADQKKWSTRRPTGRQGSGVVCTKKVRWWHGCRPLLVVQRPPRPGSRPKNWLAGKKSGLQGEKLVYTPYSTLQARKTRFVPKTNQKGSKTKVRGTRHIARSLEN